MSKPETWIHSILSGFFKNCWQEGNLGDCFATAIASLFPSTGSMILAFLPWNFVHMDGMVSYTDSVPLQLNIFTSELWNCEIIDFSKRCPHSLIRKAMQF